MYEEYFGLRRKPFENTAETEFFYYSPVHKEALVSLLYGIREQKNLLLVSGERGTGKTMLLNMLISRLNERNSSDNGDEAIEGDVIIHIVNPSLKFEVICDYIAKQLGIEKEYYGDNILHFIDALQDKLEVLARRGRKVIIIFDDAHKLSDDELENINMIVSNVNNNFRRLLYIVLAADSVIWQKLEQQRHRPLRSRLILSRMLSGLSREETKEYIENRIKIASNDYIDSYEDVDILLSFTDNAVDKIYNFTSGVPEKINDIAEAAIKLAYSRESYIIDDRIVAEILENISLYLNKDIYTAIPAKDKKKKTTNSTATSKFSDGAVISKPETSKHSKPKKLKKEKLAGSNNVLILITKNVALLLLIFSIIGIGLVYSGVVDSKNDAQIAGNSSSDIEQRFQEFVMWVKGSDNPKSDVEILLSSEKKSEETIDNIAAGQLNSDADLLLSDDNVDFEQLSTIEPAAGSAIDNTGSAQSPDIANNLPNVAELENLFDEYQNDNNADNKRNSNNNINIASKNSSIDDVSNSVSMTNNISSAQQNNKQNNRQNNKQNNTNNRTNNNRAATKVRQNTAITPSYLSRIPIKFRPSERGEQKNLEIDSKNKSIDEQGAQKILQDDNSSANLAKNRMALQVASIEMPSLTGNQMIGSINLPFPIEPPKQQNADNYKKIAMIEGRRIFDILEDNYGVANTTVLDLVAAASNSSVSIKELGNKKQLFLPILSNQDIIVTHNNLYYIYYSSFRFADAATAYKKELESMNYPVTLINLAEDDELMRLYIGGFDNYEQATSAISNIKFEFMPFLVN